MGYDDGQAPEPLLAEAFTAPQAWAAFYDEATSGAHPTAARWARHWNKTMKTQTPRRASLPPHYATGAIEPKLATVRQMLERRRWTLRNRRRMNTLLELVRQRLNRTDDVTRWAGLVRADLEAGGGRPSNPRRMADPVTRDSGGNRVYSLTRVAVRPNRGRMPGAQTARLERQTQRPRHQTAVRQRRNLATLDNLAPLGTSRAD